MKAIHLFLVLILLTHCKRKENIDPMPPVAAEPTQPFGITDFTVKGVAKENIRFTTLHKDSEDHQVVITLPADFPSADSIRVSMKLPEGFEIRNNFNKPLNPEGFSVLYRDSGLTIAVVNSATGNVAGGLHLVVDPVKPIVVSSSVGDHALALEGEELYIPLLVQNWGTYTTVVPQGAGQPDSLVYGQALFRNLITGTVTVSRISWRPNQQGSSLFASVPAGIEAGDYEMTVVRHNRRAVVPDKLSLKYGAPKISRFYSISIFSYESSQIAYSGYNLLPGHTYELELSSDFFPKQRFPLTPTSRLRISAQLPASLKPGTYKTTLYVDGKEVVNDNLLTKHDLVLVFEDKQQPALLVISQLRSDFSTSNGAGLYTPIAILNRTDPVVLQYQAHSSNPGVFTNDSRLFFKNTETGAEFVLPQTGFSSSMLPYRMYRSPSELPAGKYQVKFGIRHTPEGEEHISGLYYEEIVVE